MRPGDYQCDGYNVTWWDSQSLRLGVPIILGIPQQELLGREAPPGMIEADIDAYRAWRAGRDRTVESGSRSSIRVETAIERALRGADVPEIEVVTAGRSEAHGTRYGTLLHAVLAAIDFASPEARPIAELQARILGAPDHEVESVVRAVEALIEHPLIRRAASSKSVRREVPLTLAEDDALVEGVADLAFEEDAGWIVVDFKTDAEIAGKLDIYKRQVGIYARAIGAATGRPAFGVLIRV